MPRLSKKYWDLYDENKNKLGRIIERGLYINRGEYHLESEILVTNNNNQILLTQRSLNRINGGYWQFVTSAVIAGEDSFSGAKRALKEQVGIDITDKQLIFLGTKIYHDLLTDTYHLKLESHRYNKNWKCKEIINAKWVDINEFEDMCSRKLINGLLAIDRFDLYKDKINMR